MPFPKQSQILSIPEAWESLKFVFRLLVYFYEALVQNQLNLNNCKQSVGIRASNLTNVLKTKDVQLDTAVVVMVTRCYK